MKICLAWSGGKDSTFCLHQLLSENKPVERLLCTLSAETRRISMHGIREELLDEQAKALGIELQKVFLPKDCSMDEYSLIMAEASKTLVEDGFTHLAFGDIFLEDLKAYRIKNLEGSGLEPLFPIWGYTTKTLVDQFIQLDYQAKVVCCDATKLDKESCGSELDQQFIDNLPEGVDPCGENGEFHSFVYSGPIFKKALSMRVGEIELHHYPNENPAFESSFYFADYTL